MEQEIWKDVNGWEGQYQVSNFGNVRSLDKVIRQFYGSRTIKGRQLKPQKTKWGYLLVTFSNKQNHKAYSVHQLVAKAFIPNPQNKPEVNHLNGVKTDNSVNNLEWCTEHENIRHAWSTGLTTLDKMQYGESHHRSKLKGADVIEIRKSKEHKKILAQRYNVTVSTIYYIQTGRAWKRFT